MSTMGYRYNKCKLNEARKARELTVEDLTFYMGVSRGRANKILYSPNVRTLTIEVIEALERIGIKPKDIDVDLSKPVRRGRVPRGCPRCGYVERK